MASVLSLKTDIKKLKAAIASKATSGAIKTKLRGKLTNLENQLDKLQPNKRKPKTTGPKNESALVRVAKKRRTNQGLSTSKEDIERDAIRPAKKAGKRISANGNRYYEYRDNRIDNRQPPRKYRKLADGGMIYKMADNMTDAEYDNKLSSLNEKQKKTYESLVRLGDSPKLALATTLLSNEVKWSDDTTRAYTMADGGVVDKDYKDKLVKNIVKKSSGKNINGFKLVSGTFNMEGSLHWRNKQYDDIEVYATPFFTPDDEINFENYLKDTLLRKEDKDYKLTHDLDKDTETYFNYLEKKLTPSGVLPEWAVTIESEDGETYDWEGFAKNEDDALNKAEKEAGFKSDITGMTMLTYDGEQPIYKQGGYMAKGGDLSLVKKKYEENEDENAHSENVVLLAKHFGTKADLAKAKEILALHEKEGYLSSENGKKRTELHYKLIDKARSEMGKQGIKFEKGGYMAKGGKTKDQEVVRGYFEDEAYEYGSGGQVMYLTSTGNSQRLVTNKSDATPMYIMDAEYYIKSNPKNSATMVAEKIDKTLPDRVGKNYIVKITKKHKMDHGGYMADGGFFDTKSDVKFKFSENEKIKVLQYDGGKLKKLGATIIEQYAAKQPDGTYYPFYWVVGDWESMEEGKKHPSLYAEDELIERHGNKPKKMADGGETYFDKHAAMQGGVDYYSVEIDDIDGEQIRGLDYKSLDDAKKVYDKYKKSMMWEGNLIDDIQLVVVYKNGHYDTLHENYANGGNMADGGNIYGRQSIKSYYLDTYPTDNIGQEINDEASFEGLNKALDCKLDVYEYLGVGDSLVRERVFWKLSDLMGVSYDVIYDKWLQSDYAKGGYMADGGSVAKGNYEMLMSQAKEVMHHAKELMQVVKPNMDIEAWVVSKAERATTDLSDITHYLDGLKMAMGGMVKANTHKVNA